MQICSQSLNQYYYVYKRNYYVYKQNYFFADYFETKIRNIRKELETIKPLPSDYSSIDMASRSNCELKEFTIATTEEVRHIVNKCSSKSCCLDPVPSSVFVKHLDLLVPVITNIVNLSLKSSTMSSSLKEAVIFFFFFFLKIILFALFQL